MADTITLPQKGSGVVNDNYLAGGSAVGTPQTASSADMAARASGAAQMPTGEGNNKQIWAEIVKPGNASVMASKLGMRENNVEHMPQYQMGPVDIGAAAQSAGMDPAQQAEFRKRQLALGDALMAQSMGQGPSVAGSQLQQSTDMNLQAALAQAASSRGGSLGAAQYQLGNARANIQQQAAQQLAQTRIQEQMAARSQLGDVLNSGRGGDLSVAGMNQQNNQFNAGQTNQQSQVQGGLNQATGQANLNANVQQEQFKQDMLTKLTQGQISYQQYQDQMAVNQNQFNAGLANQAYGIDQGVGVQQSAQSTQIAGATIGAIGSMAGMAMMSDERNKTDIVDGDGHAKAFLDALVAKNYSYKDEKWGAGPRMGIMAQDAEKSALGKSFVMDTKNGKMLDVNKALSAALASMAYLNKRVNSIERK